MATYKIKDIEILTGIKAHTIRIWEKRYGILLPDRTSTKIRTYSDAELVFLLNISLLNKNGVKISHIANMSQREIIEKAEELTNTTIENTSIDQFIVALIDMNEQLFRHTLNELVEKHGMVATYQFHLIPFLERIGVMWLAGTINAAQEHFMSNLIRQKIIYETELLPTPKNNAEKVILFLPEHEWHELSILLYHFFLRSKGVYTIYLGQSLPYDSLIECVQHIQPKKIVTSWLTAVDEKYIINYFKRLTVETNAKILCGGYQILQFKESIPEKATVFHNMEELAKLLS
jgi:MerR family transcriptional regulator, light-induced transcriptional regulator